MAITAVDALIEPVTIAVTNRGPAGVAATISIGTITSIAFDEDATVANSGTATHAVLDFGLVQGEPGDAGTLTIGTVTTLDAGSNATVANAGSASEAVLNFGIPKGDKGDPPELTLGTVTTGTAGSSASGALTETDPDVYELTLTIPRGDTGAVEDVVATDITDASAIGRLILTAPDAATQRTALELGSAAIAQVTDFATAAQGEQAGTALQPADVGDLASADDAADVPFINAGTGLTSTDVQAAVAEVASMVGVVKNVVVATKTDTYSLAASTFSAVTGLSVSITPSSMANRILVLAAVSVGSTNGEQIRARLTRGGSVLSHGDAAGSRTRTGTGDATYSNGGLASLSMMGVDSPASTSAQTYGVEIARTDSGTVYVNRSGGDTDGYFYPRAVSTLIAIEVGP